MRTFTDIDIPARLAARPRDARGYPIPYAVLQPEGGPPDFRITDVNAWSQAVRLRLCALCGVPLGRHLAFVGGPLTYQNRYFTDLPMHRDCAVYALKVCPFLAAPNYRYAESLRTAPEGHVLAVSEAVRTVRPDYFFMGMTLGYRLVRSGDGTLLVRADPWREVEWWRYGNVLAERPAAADADVR